MVVFKKSYPVATAIVGIDKKNENSSAAGRDIPAICPAEMVDIEREVPGKTAERICAAPIQTACPKVISSMCIVFGFRHNTSTTHITMPPIKSDHAMTCRSSRCSEITFFKRKLGSAVTTN